MTEPQLPTPAPAPVPTPAPQPAAKKKLGTGAIVAIVLGSILVLGLIIVGILFAIAAPVYSSQQAKANDSAAKADVATLGKEIATYFVDGSGMPFIYVEGDSYVFEGSTGTFTWNKYEGVEYGGLEGSGATDWCVWVTHPEGDLKDFQYSALGGLENGRC